MMEFQLEGCRVCFPWGSGLPFLASLTVRRQQLHKSTGIRVSALLRAVIMQAEC